jgi:2-alkenal reductase
MNWKVSDQSRRLVQTALSLIVALMMFGGIATGTFAQSTDTPSPPPMKVKDSSASSGLSVVEMVARVSPAVVTVINEQQYRGGGIDDVQPAGSGTGFIVDDDGHIVTNWHVVEGGDQFLVIFADGTTRDAILVGSDEVSDLAVVQISGDLPATLGFADSSELRSGQTVLAIGSPLGAFSNTVTQGIIGATNRDFPFQSGGPQIYDDLIQHDAAINPGNSGGPLFDLDGNVVGVNTLGIPIDDQGQPVQGLFFAIPSNTVERIVEELIATGNVVYPYLGVTPIGLDVVSAAANDLPIDHGAYVNEVVVGSPADDAGLREGDIILAIDGEQIDRNRSFTEGLFTHKPGDEVTITIQRGENEVEKTITLDERSASSPAATS